MKTLETSSLILTLLASDDAQTARELADAVGTTAAALRPALCQLVENGDVVTSGRAGATRYVLAVAEQLAAPVQPVELVVTAAVVAQRAERSSTASLVLTDEEHLEVPVPMCELVQSALAAGHADVQYRRRTRGAARPVIPATVDLESALQATQQRLESGATLHELSARPAPLPSQPHDARAGRRSRRWRGC